MTNNLTPAFSAPFGELARISRRLGSRANVSKAKFTRSNNTTAYDVKQAMYYGSPSSANQLKGLVFPDISKNPGEVVTLTSARLIDFTQGATLKGDLLLFSAPLTVPPVDGVVYTPAPADVENLVGYVQFLTSLAKSIGSRYTIYDCAVNQGVYTGETNNLYGVLIAQNQYAPPSAAGQFLISLNLA